MLITPILLAAICTAGPALSPTANTSLPLEMVPLVTVQNLHYSTLFAQDEQREITGQAPAFAVPTTTSITPEQVRYPFNVYTATDGISFCHALPSGQATSTLHASDEPRLDASRTHR